MRAEILPDPPEARPSRVIMQRAKHSRADQITDRDMLLKPYVQNYDQLLSHGERSLRKMALQIIEEALEASDPYRAAKKLVHLDGSSLCVGPHTKKGIFTSLEQERLPFLLPRPWKRHLAIESPKEWLS